MRIRQGNDFIFLWAIERNGLPENLSNAVNVRLHFKNFDCVGNVQSFQIVDGNIVRVEVAPKWASRLGAYRLILSYEFEDGSYSDGDRKCVVDVLAFNIVPKTSEADDLTEMAKTTDIMIGLSGLSAYEVWLKDNPESTKEDYYNWLRQPATDIAETVNLQEQARVEAEGLRVLAEQDRQANTQEAISNAENATENANTSAQNADDARLAIKDDLALKANHGYEVGETPKTLKEVDDEKADQTDLVQLESDVKQKLTNLTTNGDFSNGTTGWTASLNTGSFTVTGGVATISNGVNYYFGIYQNVSLVAGRKYYVKFKVRSDKMNLITIIRLLDRNRPFEGELKAWRRIQHLSSSTWHWMEAIIEPTSNSSIVTINAQADGAATVVSIDIDEVMIVDMTADGIKDYTLQGMRFLIKELPYFNGIRNINPKESSLLKTREIADVIGGFEVSPKLKAIMDAEFIVSIGYDDASSSIYEHAFPIHQAQNVPATFWVVTGLVGTSSGSDSWGNKITWDNLREMQMSNLFTIGGHSHNHINYRDATAPQIHADIQSMMSEFLKEGFKPEYFSYPGGHQDEMARLYISAHFKAARGGNMKIAYEAGNNRSDAIRYSTDSVGIDSYDVSYIKTLINGLRSLGSGKVWIDMFMHMVSPTGLSTTGGTVKKPEELNEIIQYIKDNNGLIVSYGDAVSLFMEHYYWNEKSLFKAIQ